MNALAAFSNTYNTLEGMARDRASRQAGNALAGGDYQSAAGALFGRGMIDEGLGVQRYQAQQQQAAQQQQMQLDEAQKAAAAERVQTLMRATQTLRRLPAEQRPAALQQIIPILGQMPGFDEETLAAVQQSDLSDQTLDTFSQALGAEAEKYQLFQVPGVGIVRVGQSGPGEVAYQAPADPSDSLKDDLLRAQIAATQAQVPLRAAQAAKASRPPAAKASKPAPQSGTMQAIETELRKRGLIK